jgi:superfamily II DNA or RNA helicase
MADKYGLSAHGVIQASHWRFNPDLPFQIASAQTLARRSWPEFDVIVQDEAHTQLKVCTEHYKTTTANVIGLSATPFSAGLGLIYTNLINAATMHDLTQSGVLVPMRVLSCTQTNMNGAATAGGEWTDSAAQERGMEIVGDVVMEWHKYAEGKKTIVFGATIAHCEEICRQFNESGVMAGVFCSDTTPEERAYLIGEYKKHDSMLRVLVSVEALAKGFDVPDVEVVVDCRPLRKSLSTAIQMWGRGLRSSPDTGKKELTLLDHSGNIIRFKDDFEDIFFNGLGELDNGEKLDKAIRRDDEDENEAKGCPRCGHMPFSKRCMSCGFEIVKPSLVESAAGEMQEVMIGKKKMADDTMHLYEQLCTYARGNSSPDKQAGRAAHLYKDMTGNYPPRSFSFERAKNVPITSNVINKIRSLKIAFIKGKNK